MFIPEGYTNLTFVMDGPVASSGQLMTAIGFATTEPPDATQREAAFGATVGSDWWNDFISTTVTLTALRFTTGTDDPSAPVVTEFAGGTPGGAGGDVGPINTAYLVKKVTARGGRKGRGRMFWPGVQATAIDDGGMLAGAVVTAGNTAINDMVAAITTDMAGPPVLLHSVAGDGSPDPITSVELQTKLATQRQRLRD